MAQAGYDNLYKLPPFVTDLINGDDREALYVEGPVAETLSRELQTPILDELGHSLSFFATRSNDHINALHVHLLRDRSIKVAEDPGLHLLWYSGGVLIKPLPLYLLNADFWKTHLLPSPSSCEPASNGSLSTTWTYDVATLSPTCRSALGFVRTYGFLVRHSSDLYIAQDARLLPSHLTFSQFQAFIQTFRDLPDAFVSPRYHYGQLRLSRLNLAIRLLRWKAKTKPWPWRYHVRTWKTGNHVAKLVAPALFVFAAVSLVLSSMQVVIAARGERHIWEAFNKASWGFGVAMLVMIPALGLLVITAVLTLWIAQVQFGYRSFQRATGVGQFYKI